MEYLEYLTNSKWFFQKQAFPSRSMSIYSKALYVLNIFEVDDVQGKRMKRQLTSVQCFSFNMLNGYSALTESLHEWL